MRIPFSPGQPAGTVHYWPILLMATALTGCGGSSNYDSSVTPTPARKAFATFVDRTAGLGVLSAGTANTTNAEGLFEFTVGQPTTFFVGSADRRLEIGISTLPENATAATLITPRNFSASGAAAAENATVNALRLLQTLDVDRDFRNGVNIDASIQQQVAAALTATVAPDFSTAPAQFGDLAPIAAVLRAVNRPLLAPEVALANFSLNFRQSRSSSVALTPDDRRLLVVNRQKASVSLIEVRDAAGADTQTLLGEVSVGREPRFVAIAPDGRRAYVTSAIDGTLTTIDISGAQPALLGNAVAVGVEPRGIALSPSGRYALIANSTMGSVAVYDTTSGQVVQRVVTGGNPQAVSISNDGDGDDGDEVVYVTRLYSEVIDPARPDGFDDARQGVIDSFVLGDALANRAQVGRLLLKPFASGFAADRRNFCLATRQALQGSGTRYFNSGADGSGNGAAALARSTFCPDNNSADASADGPIGKVAQKVYPNMLNASLLRGNLLYVANIGASPEPPVRFNVNVHGLVGVLDRFAGNEPFTLNLNAQIKDEVQPAEGSTSLARLFMNDLVAGDADQRGEKFLFVSRGGNFVIRANRDALGKLSIGAPATVRLQTGNLPSGVAMSGDGKRAYTNNELSTSVSALDLENNRTLALDINSSTPPNPGTPEHNRLIGKLTFFTALGLPDSGLSTLAIRDIVPINHKGKASDNSWSSCASCHEDGHADNVSWIFPTGPRSTIPLEGSFARGDASNQRVFNWSGVQGSFTDFNNNARGIQGGRGFATSVNGSDNSTRAFNHGFVRGVSESLDAMHEWATTIRAPIMPDPPVVRGREMFGVHCAGCHGGKKWTKSRTSPIYSNNPTFNADPIGPAFFAGNNPPLDPKLIVAGPQIKQINGPQGVDPLILLDNVGTFNAADALELRGAGAVGGQVAQGFAALGAAGYNTPSLLGLAFSGPWLHDGSAETMDEVFARHKLAGGQSIQQIIGDSASLSELKEFILSIDEQTPIMDSDAERFVRQAGIPGS